MINRAKSLRITGLVTASSTLSLLRSAVSLSGTTTTTLQFQPAGQRSSCPSTRKLITNWCNWRKRLSKILPVVRIPVTTSSTRSHLSKSVYDNIYNSMISPACLWPIHILCGERVELENTFRKQPDNDGGGGLQLRARWPGRRLRGDSWPFCWLQLPHGVGLSSQRCEENKRIYWK